MERPRRCAFCPPDAEPAIECWPVSQHMIDLRAELAIRAGNVDPRLDPVWVERVALCRADAELRLSRHHITHVLPPVAGEIFGVRDVPMATAILESMIEGRVQHAHDHGDPPPFEPWTAEGAARFFARREVAAA